MSEMGEFTAYKTYEMLKNVGSAGHLILHQP